MTLDQSGGGLRNAGRLFHGGNLRAAILGVNDGLVSNFTLVMGVAGGVSDATIVLLAGIAGLLAGAFSMAAGEYISVSSQRDVSANRTRGDDAVASGDTKASLIAMYLSSGLTESESSAVASRVSSDPELAAAILRQNAPESEEDAIGSPIGAAISSFVSFVLGAVVPIVPYLLDAGSLAFTLSATLSAIALVTVGTAVAFGSGKNPVWGAIRMLLAGGLAASVTFGIGRLVGISLSA